MDGRRFDQLTQTLARRLGRDGGPETGSFVRPLSQPALRVAPEALSISGGTCRYQEQTPAESRAGQDLAHAICGWEQPPAAVTTNHGSPPDWLSRSARRRLARPLSRREQEVATLIGQGLKDREIAAALVLSERTVHAHVRGLLDKLSLASRVQIAAWATEHGLLQPTTSADADGGETAA
jgi:DNA-binding CsgD family transcriptional regulator